MFGKKVYSATIFGLDGSVQGMYENIVLSSYKKVAMYVATLYYNLEEHHVLLDEGCNQITRVGGIHICVSLSNTEYKYFTAYNV